MFNSKKNKRIAELEAGIARLFEVVHTIEGVYEHELLFWFENNNADVKRLHNWLDRIELARKEKALEIKIKAVVAENCKPTKRK